MKTYVCISAFCRQIANKVVSLQNKYCTNSQNPKRRGYQLHKLSKQNNRAVFCCTIHYYSLEKPDKKLDINHHLL